MGFDVTDVGVMKTEEERELKKHAATIHCSNALSLLQRKVSNALLYYAYKELLVREEHEISIKQLCQLISYQGNNHTAIKEALKGLLSTIIEWNVVSDTPGEDWTASSIIASVSLKGPICRYAYSPRMKQLLHSPSMFGKINLVIQARFKSSYGLALYENCIRYRGLPYTKWLDMETFRKLMGVPSDKYTIFRDFKKRVLDKSIEEVNAFSDLMVEPELFREGRVVTRIRFSLKEREKKTRLGGQVQNESASLMELSTDQNEEMMKMRLLNVYGLSLDQIQTVMKEYSFTYLAEKLMVIENSRNFQQGKVQNLAGYLMSALKNDYQPAKTTITPALKQTKTLELTRLQRMADHIQEQYQAHRDKQIDEAIDVMASTQKEVFLNEFYEFAKSSINTILKLQRSKYTMETVLQSPQIKVLLRQFALDHLNELRSSLLTFETFLETLPNEKREGWRQFQNRVKENPSSNFGIFDTSE